MVAVVNRLNGRALPVRSVGCEQTKAINYKSVGKRHALEQVELYSENDLVDFSEYYFRDYTFIRAKRDQL